jgi:hypothetical protein
MRKIKRPLAWRNREEDLQRVKRYHKFEVMFYRTDLLIHSDRVQRILKELLPYATPFYPNLNWRLALLISRFHDDYEMVSERGDVPLQFKLQMIEEGGKELSILEQEEIAAAEFLSRSYRNPIIGGYRYKDLLMHSILKDCPEAQLHSFADKMDGYGEALHEVLAGNTCFLEPVMTYLARIFNDLPGKFPLIQEVFKFGNGHFSFPVIDLIDYFEKGNIGSFLHTPKTIESKKTKISHYEFWKKVTLSMPNGLEILTKQKEFHNNANSKSVV